MNGTIRLDRKRQQWRADVMVNGTRRRKHFSISTPELVMRNWIRAQLGTPEPITEDAAALWRQRWTAYTEGRRLPPPARGISWTLHGWHMPGTNTQAVAEMTLLLMLATLRRLHELSSELLNGNGWKLPADTLDGLGEIAGRTVGLVGFGAVGQRLVPMLQGLQARVIYTDLNETRRADASFASLPELLSQSDVVSLHLPLTPATAKMMNADTLRQMKRGAILINAARGGLVDENALIDALTTGHLGGAGLDVFGTEPVLVDNPLLRCPNVVVTPHLAWLTAETLARSLSVFHENCRRLRDGKELLHRVV